jgi:riboflavin synthase
LLARTPGTEWQSFRFGLPAEVSKYVAEKGSIAVNGVSLTVTAVGTVREDRSDEGGRTGAIGNSTNHDCDWFEVGLIPETLRATNLGSLAAGDPVNIEVDVLAKYTERLLTRGAGLNTHSNTSNGGG